MCLKRFGKARNMSSYQWVIRLVKRQDYSKKTRVRSFKKHERSPGSKQDWTTSGRLLSVAWMTLDLKINGFQFWGNNNPTLACCFNDFLYWDISPARYIFMFWILGFRLLANHGIQFMCNFWASSIFQSALFGWKLFFNHEMKSCGSIGGRVETLYLYLKLYFIIFLSFTIERGQIVLKTCWKKIMF